VRDDHDPARAHERLTHVEVEEIAQAQAHDQQRVHYRAHVVGTDVGQAEDHHVALAFHVYELLAVEVGDGGGVHGFDLARLHACHLMGGQNGLEYRPLGRRAE